MTAADELPAVQTARPRSLERRARLLQAARDLLRERGWHAVAMGDIGAAAGISGPAVYRHFKNKEELLVAALQHAADLLWSALPQGPGDGPEVLLRAYVDGHARFVVENTDLVELWYQESRHLPGGARTAQRRLQRRYVERWVDVLLECRPELSPDEARIMVRGAIGTLHSVVHSDRLFDESRLRAVLGDMIMAALLPAGTSPVPRRVGDASGADRAGTVRAG